MFTWHAIPGRKGGEGRGEVFYHSEELLGVSCLSLSFQERILVLWRTGKDFFFTQRSIFFSHIPRTISSISC